MTRSTMKSCACCEGIAKYAADSTSVNVNSNLHSVTRLYCSHAIRKSKPCCLHAVRTTIDLLLDDGADIDTLDDRKLTALLIAVNFSMFELCRYLLSAGANPNVGSARYRPIVQACRLNNTRMVALLLSAGANPDGVGSEPNAPMAQLGEMPTYGWVTRFYATATPLDLAIADCNVEITNLLLRTEVNPTEEECGWSSVNRTGADVNRADNHGLYPLHRVLDFGNSSQSFRLDLNHSSLDSRVRMVEILLKAGANPNELSTKTWQVRPLERLFQAVYSASTYPFDVVLESVSRLFETLAKGGASIGDSRDTAVNYSSIILCRFYAESSYYQRSHSLLLRMLRIGVGFTRLAFLGKGLGLYNADKPEQTKPNTEFLKSVVMLTGCQMHRALAASLGQYYRVQLRSHKWANLYTDAADWLDAQCKTPPSLMRQCRVFIRRALSEANGYTSLEPLVERLTRSPDQQLIGSPDDIFGLYLLFDGPAKEDLSE